MLHQKAIPNIVLRIVCVAWLMAKLVSYKLWLATRLFPLAPVSNILSGIPAWGHTALFVAGLAAITAVIIFPARRGFIIAVMAIEVASCLLDQNRWQPWEYQYLFFMLVFMANTNRHNALKAIAFILAGTYIYSGLNKLTPGFLSAIWDGLILHQYLHIPARIIHQRWVYNSGYLLAIAETLLGVGLFFKRTQKASAMLILAMHAFIILFLSITGIKHNAVVWPWNAALAIIVYLLFVPRYTPAADRQVLLKGISNTVWLCWGLLPAFCFAGLWDNYLSANLYSGRQPFMIICISNTATVAELKPYLEQDANHLCNGQAIINVNRWAFTELKVPPYPQHRLHLQLKQQFNARYPGAGARFLSFAHALWRGKPAHNKPFAL